MNPVGCCAKKGKNVVLLLGLILLTTDVSAQFSQLIVPLDAHLHHIPSLEEFEKYGLASVEVHQFESTKKGKVKNDSTRLCAIVFHPDKRTLSGLNSHWTYQSHGPNFLSWYKFINHYDEQGRLVREMEEPLNHNKRKEFGFLFYDINKTFRTLAYNDKGQLRKEIKTHEGNSFSIYKSTKDTSHHRSIQSDIYEYVFDSLGREIERYITDDSTRYLNTATISYDSNAVRCHYCHPRYKSIKTVYGKNQKPALWISYTRNGEFHSKRSFYYDDQDRLIRRVDSTGWYIGTKSGEYPRLDQTIEWEHRESQVWKRRIIWPNKMVENEYDSLGNVLRSCSTYASQAPRCIDSKYEYHNGQPIKETRTFPNGETITEENRFTENGLLKEQRQYKNKTLVYLLRYKYWKLPGREPRFD